MEGKKSKICHKTARNGTIFYADSGVAKRGHTWGPFVDSRGSFAFPRAVQPRKWPQIRELISESDSKSQV